MHSRSRAVAIAQPVGVRRAHTRNDSPMQSFVHTFKTELVMHCDYQTRDQARASLFDYMEVFYNRQRRHSTLNYEAPLAFRGDANRLIIVSTERGYDQKRSVAIDGFWLKSERYGKTQTRQGQCLF